MSRRSKDISTLVEDLRVLHMAVAKPLRHFQLLEDFDRPSKMVVGSVARSDARSVALLYEP